VDRPAGVWLQPTRHVQGDPEGRPDNQIAEADEANNTLTQVITYLAPPNLTAFVLERAARSYASVAPADSVVALLRLAATR
jgi:hypothetical protein